MAQLFFDVETTGLPPRAAKPRQFQDFSGCRVVSIAWVLRDGLTVFSQRYSVVDTGGGDGAKVGAEHIHGVTCGVMRDHGRLVEAVLRDFMEDVKKATLVVAHNMDFDQKVVAAELYRMGCNDDAEYLMQQQCLCTMKTTTDLVKIKTKYGSYKWPKLCELHAFLFGSAFDNAHHAMCDVDALVKCFYEMRRVGWPAAMK
ncbi:unnamed protein product [Ectocarpus sp. 8 AP-2014]